MFPRKTHTIPPAVAIATRDFGIFLHTWVISESDAFFFSLEWSCVQNPCKNSEIHSRTATSPWFSAKSLRPQLYHLLRIRVGRCYPRGPCYSRGPWRQDSSPRNKHFSSPKKKQANKHFLPSHAGRVVFA